MSYILVFQFVDFIVTLMVLIMWVTYVVDRILHHEDEEETSLYDNEELPLISKPDSQFQTSVFSFALGTVGTKDIIHEPLLYVYFELFYE